VWHATEFDFPMQSRSLLQSVVMNDGSKKAIVAAFGANLGIAIAKFIGFAATRSAGMLAEAVHSLADTGNQGLLLLGSKKAKKEATAKHPFGYGRERYFWAFTVALVIFILGGAFALYEGVDKLAHPHEPHSIVIGLVILAISIGLETFSLRTALHEAKEMRGSAKLLDFVRHAKSPELPVVLLEDIGALIGLVLALGGLIMAKITGNGRWDAVGSLAIGILLIAIAVFLCIEMKSLLIGEAASDADETSIIRAIEGSPEVLRLIHIRTLHIGPDEVLLGAKVHFDDSFTTAQLAVAIDSVEARVRQAVPSTRVIYIEPDIGRIG
jgi:cation diffusion facilitator family transporter